MTDEIKALLKELTSYGKVYIELNYLKKADDEIGFKDVIFLVSRLLQWQKYVIHEDKNFYSMFHKDKLELKDINRMKYTKLFEVLPVLGDVYHLGSAEITFNENLSKDSIDKILNYINVHYKIRIRAKGPHSWTF